VVLLRLFIDIYEWCNTDNAPPIARWRSIHFSNTPNYISWSRNTRRYS